MSENILSQHEEIINRNQAILERFISSNRRIPHVSTRSLVYGIGVNNSNYTTRSKINGEKSVCIFYRKWKSMLQRCYSEKYKNLYPSYKLCVVCNEWLIFSNFKRWMESHDYEGLQLDKDILRIGNKTYSPDNCIFVTSAVNSLLLDRKSARGKYPQGVDFDKSRNKYKSQLNINSIIKYIGHFNNIEEAEDAYVKAKSSHIIRVALEQTSDKLMKALIMHASYMRVNFECRQRLIK